MKIMIDWCNLRRPLQCAGTTWNDVVELSCCAIGVALSSLASPDSTSATVKFSTVSAGEFATTTAATTLCGLGGTGWDRVSWG